MNPEYYSKFSEMAKKAQEPLQAMAELNVKTFQELTYLKPEDLTKVKKPEEMFEKQVELAISNGRKALEYMQKSFEIYERAMLSCVHDTKGRTDGIKK